MKTFLFTIQEYIGLFIFGRHCAGCKKPGPAICNRCLSLIPLASSTQHPDIYGLYNYGHPLVSHAVWNLKYRHAGQEAKLLSKRGAGLVNEIIAEHLQSEQQQEITLVPVPQYKKKTASRGFNQSAVIADWFSQEIPESRVEDVLEKTKETLPQSHLADRKARIRNIDGTMQTKNPPASGLDPKKIYIVVDDVTTTGATFLEAKRALQTAGAKHILCIALAHGYKRR